MTALDCQVEQLAVVFHQRLVTLRTQNQILELALFRIKITSRVYVTDASMVQQAVS